MPHTRLRDAWPRPSEVGLLCVVRGLSSLAAYASGFRALSDDDYARIAIAQRFAETPSFDPSQTSWLPAPFWVYGCAFRWLGTELSVARATAIGLSTLATLVVYVAARLLGACRPGALLGAALCTLLPHSALLGIAAVPEVPCAALIVLGAATLAQSSPRLRAFGGVALSVACLSRYEAWPVAVIFAARSGWDARANRSLALGAALALLGPGVWLLWGRVEHGSALFFVTRVASYRRALGPARAGSLTQLLCEYPALLVRAEPELWGLLVVVGGYGWRRADRALLAPYWRAGSSLLALLAFLMLGSVRDGVPTHHAARVLLPIWFFMCLLCGHGLAHLAARASRAELGSIVALSAAAVLAGLLAGPHLLPSERSAQRERELSAGSEARRRQIPELAIDTPDYGYFAVQAGFGSPTRSSPLDDHDPRRARPSDPFASEASLSEALRARGARFLIATTEHAAEARGRCVERWRNAGFLLLECEAAR